MNLETVNRNKMNAQQLRYYPRLNNVLTDEYRNSLIHIFRCLSGESLGRFMNIYSCFVDIVERKSDIKYNAFDIYNNEERFNQHFTLLVGFVYSEIDSGANSKYSLCRLYIKIFKEVAQRHHLRFDEINASSTRVTDDVQSSIECYLSTPKNRALLDYYSGWTCHCKKGKEFNLHLANLLDAYGENFTYEIHQVISNYSRTQTSKTFGTRIPLIINLLNEFILHCPTLEKLNYAMKAENSTSFMLNVFNTLLADYISQGHTTKIFFRRWGALVIPVFITCFIDSNFFEEPLKPFICPVFKEKKSGKKMRVSTGDKLTENEKDRLFSAIPLEIKDDQVIEVIRDRINRDIDHVRVVCIQLVHKINERHDRNMTFRKSGQIKPYPCSTSKKDGGFPIGSSFLENTVATFYHYGYGCGVVVYQDFLGFKGKVNTLIDELNLPTLNTLLPFLVLLVIEHPKITPAWLNEWKLFDKSGNLVGFKQVGEQWVAVSYKNRRGVTLAQQEIILTEHSKFVVESLIAHTQFAREGLRKLGGKDWHYVAITSGVIRPKVYNRGVGDALVTCNRDKFIEQLITDSFSDKEGKRELILSENNAEHLAPLVTLRNIRKNRGLQVYLQTQSIRAVSEVLGHNEPNLDTLGSYLPKPLMDFFNARWVRIFQNAIIFEALKESPYLVEALDFSEEGIEAFLQNHHLGELPSYLQKANESLVDEESQRDISQLDELVFTLTTPLLQVLIAISAMVETASEDEIFTSIVHKWYGSADFILSHFTLVGKSTTYVQGVKESQSLYETAVRHPLDINQFKSNFLCR